MFAQKAPLFAFCSRRGYDLSAYLNDISIAPLGAMFDSLDKLREIGPVIGLYFDDFLKNYFYVPVRFKETFLELFAERGGNRVIKVVSDEAAGAIKAGLKRWRRRSGNGSQLRMEQWLGRSWGRAFLSRSSVALFLL